VCECVRVCPPSPEKPTQGTSIYITICTYTYMCCNVYAHCNTLACPRSQFEGIHNMDALFTHKHTLHQSTSQCAHIHICVVMLMSIATHWLVHTVSSRASILWMPLCFRILNFSEMLGKSRKSRKSRNLRKQIPKQLKQLIFHWKNKVFRLSKIPKNPENLIFQ